MWKQTAFKCCMSYNALNAIQPNLADFFFLLAKSHFIELHPIMNTHTFQSIQLMMSTCASTAVRAFCFWWQFEHFQSNLQWQKASPEKLYIFSLKSLYRAKKKKARRSSSKISHTQKTVYILNEIMILSFELNWNDVQLSESLKSISNSGGCINSDAQTTFWFVINS